MKTWEDLFQNSELQDADNLDALLELAEITRQLIADGREAEIGRLIRRTVETSCLEAFSWIMAILQEALKKPEGGVLRGFSCELGGSIPQYHEFTQRLQVDFHVLDNAVEKTCDAHGEVQSFFNIFTYRTAYPNIFLVTEENFDLRDNDFIRYKLRFILDTHKTA